MQVGILSWYEWSKLDGEGREAHLQNLIASLTAEAGEQNADDDMFAESSMEAGPAGKGEPVAASPGAVARLSGSTGVPISRGHMRASPSMQETPPR